MNIASWTDNWSKLKNLNQTAPSSLLLCTYHCANLTVTTGEHVPSRTKFTFLVIVEAISYSPEPDRLLFKQHKNALPSLWSRWRSYDYYKVWLKIECDETHHLTKLKVCFRLIVTFLAFHSLLGTHKGSFGSRSILAWNNSCLVCLHNFI